VKNEILAATTILMVVALGCGSTIQTQVPAETPIAPVVRGEYLVKKVAMCGDCHTPRNADGSLDEARWLQGAELDFAPVQPIPVWGGYAPSLAGLVGWTDEAAAALFESGVGRGGQPLRPPMPHYRMNREDAAAVIAYLRSLE
jgi:mono/diheme cytochrome c family protein